MSLQEQRAEVTRSAIRDAMLAILNEEHPAAVSMPAVAQRAGVSVRTVYRYFPNKQALLDEVAEWHLEQASGRAYGPAMDTLIEETGSFLPQMWRHFAENLDSVKAQHGSPVGADIRARRRAGMFTQVRKEVEGYLPSAPAHDIDRLTDLVMMMTSSGAFLELVDRGGQQPERAAKLAWWGVQTLIAAYDPATGLDPAHSNRDPSQAKAPGDQR